MKSLNTKTCIAVSNDGDVIINQGPAGPVFFLSRAQVPLFLQAPTTTTVVLISNVGAAAVRTMLAANATFDAQEIDTPAGIRSVILRFRIPNGLGVAYITDEVLAQDTARLAKLGVDLAVTDGGITWQRQHAPLIGKIITHIPPEPPQLTQLEHYNALHLAKLVRDSLKNRKSANKTTITK